MKPHRGLMPVGLTSHHSFINISREQTISMSVRDPYQILGVASTSTHLEIRSAFLKRIKVLHPDRFDKASQPAEWEMANQMLQEVNEAYSELKDLALPMAAPVAPVASVEEEFREAEKTKSNKQSSFESRSSFLLTCLVVGLGPFVAIPTIILTHQARARGDREGTIGLLIFCYSIVLVWLGLGVLIFLLPIVGTL